MSTEELSALTDEALLCAVRARITAFHDAEDDATVLSRLNAEQTVLYVADTYFGEIGQGGLCQYFVNDGALTAPMLSEALAAIGADAHRALFDTFVHDHAIDLHTLADFLDDRYPSIDKCREAMEKRYPLTEFDVAYYKLPQPNAEMVSYVRTHISSF